MKPELILTAFLNAWVALDWQKAFNATSKTWSHGSSPKSLEAILSPVKVDSFVILDVKHTSPSGANIEVNIISGEKIINETIKMVRESWPGIKDPHGDWGVNLVMEIQPEKVKKVTPTKPAPAKKLAAKKPVKKSK